MENLEYKRADRIKNLLAIPPNKRNDKQLLELMNLFLITLQPSFS